MAPGGRFCIHCGSEIGDVRCCSNPDCRGLPNFYRHVRAPETVAGAPDDSPETLVADAPPAAAALSPEAETTRPAADPVAVLRSLSPSEREHLVYPGRVEIGARRPAKIVINRPEISSRHARLECFLGAGGRWQVSLLDLGSTNGTFLNGKRITSSEIHDGDRIAFAKPDYAFEFRLLSSSDEPRATMKIT